MCSYQNRHVICVCAWALTGPLLVAEPIQPQLAPSNFQSSMKYSFNKVIKQQCILRDPGNQSLIRDTSGQYLMAAALNGPNQEGKETTQPSSLLFLCFFQAFCFQKTNPSRSLTHTTLPRIGGGCRSSPQKPLVMVGLSAQPGCHTGASGLDSQHTMWLSDAVPPSGVPAILTL